MNPAAAADLGRHPDETIGAHPGDQLVPDPDGAATMATTLRRRTHYLAYSFLRHCGLSRW